MPSRSSKLPKKQIHVEAGMETEEAVSKWTPKERLDKKPADRELFPGLPLSGFF